MNIQIWWGQISEQIRSLETLASRTNYSIYVAVYIYLQNTPPPFFFFCSGPLLSADDWNLAHPQNISNTSVWYCFTASQGFCFSPQDCSWFQDVWGKPPYGVPSLLTDCSKWDYLWQCLTSSTSYTYGVDKTKTKTLSISSLKVRTETVS